MIKLRNNNTICALVINIIIIIIYFSLFNIVLETNDEFAFSAFLSGAYGESSPYMVFSNVFYGMFLKIFYSLEIGVNWYSIFQILLNFISFSVITYIILMRTEKYERKIIRCIFCFSLVLFLGYQHYYLMQFTKSAYLIALAGILSILYALNDNRSNKWVVFGCLLVLFGSFIRFSSVYVVLAFAFFRCAYDLIILQRFSLKKNYIVKNIRYVVSFFIMLVLIFGFDIADNMMYKHNTNSEQWTYYNQYNVARSELLDYGIPDYEKHKEEYYKLGLSEVDIKMLNNWTFSDPEVFNLETLEKIIELKENDKLLIIQVVKNTIKNVFEGIKTNIGFMTMIAIFLFCICGNGKQRILGLLYITMTLLLYGYLSYIDRVIFRSEYGIWLSMFILLIYDYPMISNMNLASKRLMKTVWTTIMAVIIVLSIKTYVENHERFNIGIQDRYWQLFDYTNIHQENLYMRDVSTLSDWNRGYSTLQALPQGYLSNIYLLGGWEIENPNTNVERKFGVYNPWRECIDSDVIYIIDNQGIELKLKYIKQHYCSTAKAIQVNDVAGFKIYKIVS